VPSWKTVALFAVGYVFLVTRTLWQKGHCKETKTCIIDSVQNKREAYQIPKKSKATSSEHYLPLSEQRKSGGR
jgi:hypothetical protein